MGSEWLRVASFVAYLASWVAVGVGAAVGAVAGARRKSKGEGSGAGLGLGVLLQVAAVLPVTLTLGDGALRPAVGELAGALVLAPLGAGLYWWALRSGESGLVTGGAFAVVRHPMYLGFFLLVVATALLASARWTLAAAVVVYALGTELRVAREEAELGRRFGDEHASYRAQTRWRWLPGLR
ncbi:MAG: isoprenylcysteine carboxylmethyltransferase family protein [Bryobacterales bacterium]|nr:isoprenylcysteine carboxylmethyltransferase family protein [Bryobacterales bacterium]